MKQLILKELREQYKVALIGMVVLAASLIFTLVNYGNCLRETMQQQTFFDNFHPLLNHDLLLRVAIFCAIFGTLLGWLQIRAEHQPGLWAFLVHRPMKRTRILQGKVMAGLLLYAGAAGMPLLGFVLWVSLPGNVAAPFGWAMALPLATFFLVGMVHYFGGMLAGLRKARWYAGRGAGVGLAVVATLALIEVPELWQAVLLLSGTGCVLAVAVWGNFRTGGYYQDQPVAGKAALALAATVSSFALVWVLLGVLIYAFSSRGGHSYTRYEMSREGKILRVTHRDLGETDIADVNGRTLIDEKSGQKIHEKDHPALYAHNHHAIANDAPSVKWTGREFYAHSRFFSPYAIGNKTLWYLTADGRMVGYDGITRHSVGALAPHGTTGEGASDDSHFLLPHYYSTLSFISFGQPRILTSARTAYEVDLDRRQLKPLMTVSDGDVILGFSERSSSGDTSALILTRRTIHLFNQSRVRKLDLPYVPAPTEYAQVTVYLLDQPDVFAVMFESMGPRKDETGGYPLPHVKWVNADGSIREARDLPKLPDRNYQPNIVERIAIAFIPPSIPIWSWKELYRIWNLLRIVPAILCACVGWWLGRRNQFSRKAQVVWALHHLLFGLPGLLAFLTVHDWPVKVACPACKKPRAVDRNQCESCGADFAPPAKTGTEIFAPLSAG